VAGEGVRWGGRYGVMESGGEWTAGQVASEGDEVERGKKRDLWGAAGVRFARERTTHRCSNTDTRRRQARRLPKPVPANRRAQRALRHV